MIQCEESAKCVGQACRVKLTWDVVSWRSSQEFISYLNNESREALLSPTFETNAGDWLLEIIFDKASKPRTFGSTHLLVVKLYKASSKDTPSSLLIKGNVKLKSKTASQLVDCDLWRQQFFFHEILSDGRAISHDLGDIRDIPNSVEVSAVFDVFGLLSAAQTKTSVSNVLLSPPSHLSTDLHALLNDKDFFDVAISVGGETFNAHRAILAARSPVLSAMLRSDMREKHEGTIKITDASPSAWYNFQHFLYTEAVPAEEECDLELLSQLLMMCDKYAVPSLVIHVQRAIIQRLTRDNVLQTYKMVDPFDVPQLKEAATALLLQIWDDLAKEDRQEVFKIASLAEAMFMKIRI